MNQSIIEYFHTAPEQLHFVFRPEYSREHDQFYKMISEYGDGNFRIINFNNTFLILIANYTPKESFEKVSTIYQDYFEISQFETDASSFKVGGRKTKNVEQGICCYVNTNKTVHAYCEGGKLTKFTKIIITKDYFDSFLKERYGDHYESFKDAMKYVSKNPISPELNFVFQQIRDCQAVGASQHIYLESKVLEVLSLVTHDLHQSMKKTRLSVKLDKKDKRLLNKVITFMKKDLSEYPSIKKLSSIANMSETRFQMAFKQVYGTTVYQYLKEMRMNHALLLLQNSDDSVQMIAQKVGYTNAGHFAGIFKETYGITPKKYRNIHYIE
ncbi:AraC family transcriptional regulator [Inediibacterium massiliense]|uniref:AraC family transcriptional regulator n=1 Tax=Inediibacterium massiliense TaxID=1658111 RepID=UPI0006B4FF73|nr:AraC family transcriptional regulator [Inediibacterium massiliense]